MPDKPQELLVIEKEGGEIVHSYMAIEVHDEQGLTDAAVALANIRSFLKKAEDTRKALVQPLNDHVKWINDQFKVATNPMKDADAHVSTLIQDYRAMIEQARVIEQNSLWREAEDRREAAELAGEPSPIPEAIAPIVEGGARIIATDSGQMQFMKVNKWEIEEEELIPREFLIADLAAITKAVKEGRKEIQGIKIWTVDVPVIRGKSG